MKFISNLIERFKGNEMEELPPAPRRPAFEVLFTEQVAERVWRVITMSTADGSITDQNVLILPEKLMNPDHNKDEV